MTTEPYEADRHTAGTSADPHELTQLATSPDADVRMLVAENSDTPIELLLQLAADKVWDVRLSIAGNDNTPPTVLTQYVTDEDDFIREVISGNNNTPIELLTTLAQDELEDIRQRAQDNLNRRQDVQAARDHTTPPETLAQLAHSTAVSVRLYVAQNPSTPLETFTQLATDENAWVSEQAQQVLDSQQ